MVIHKVLCSIFVFGLICSEVSAQNKWYYDGNDPKPRLRGLIDSLQAGTSLTDLEDLKLIRKVGEKWDLRDIYFYGLFVDKMRENGIPDFIIYQSNFLPSNVDSFIVIRTSSMSNVDFSGSDLRGVTFAGQNSDIRMTMEQCLFAGIKDLYLTQFIDVILNGSTFTQTAFNTTNFYNVEFKEVEFRGSDQTTFTNVVLFGIEFRDTILENVTFDNVLFKHVEMTGQFELKNCTFNNPTIGYFQMYDGKIYNTEFTNVRDDQKIRINKISIPETVYIDTESTINGKSLKRFVRGVDVRNILEVGSAILGILSVIVAIIFFFFKGVRDKFRNLFKKRRQKDQID